MQLPLNARMPEAWRDAWQPLPQHGAEGRGQGKEQMGTLLEAASRLGVGVFASGPLHEGQLLADSAIQVRLLPPGQMACSSESECFCKHICKLPTCACACKRVICWAASNRAPLSGL